MYPYTPLHDVNVTSIYSNTRTHILIFLYKTNLPFDLYLRGKGIDVVFSLHTTRKSVKNPHLFLLLTHSNDYYNTYHSLLEKSLVCHFYWLFSFDYLKVDAVMFINYFFIYVYCNHKNYLIGGGDWKLLFEWLTRRMER